MTNKKYLPKFLILFIAVFLFTSCNEDRKLDENDARLDSLSQELAKYKKDSDSLIMLLEKSGLATGYPVFYGKKFDTIENPEEYIAKALEKHSDKIPMDPVLGGTMEFRKVQVLTEDWLLAVYDDGHVQGKSIFKYQLQPDGSLKFTHIASKMPK